MEDLRKAYYLVVELRCNPHVQVHIQLFVVRHKWTGYCSTRNNVHHWCLNLKKQQTGFSKAALTNYMFLKMWERNTLNTLRTPTLTSKNPIWSRKLRRYVMILERVMNFCLT